MLRWVVGCLGERLVHLPFTYGFYVTDEYAAAIHSLPATVRNTVIRLLLDLLGFAQNKQRVLRRLRREFKSLGFDLAALSDEELEKSIMAFGRCMSRGRSQND